MAKPTARFCSKTLTCRAASERRIHASGRCQRAVDHPLGDRPEEGRSELARPRSVGQDGRNVLGTAGDPGRVQYDTTINRWHTCPNSGRINASNPCSEYMFLDDTACNLASINLMKFRQADGTFDVERFQAACRVFFIAQEILVDHASYPTHRRHHVGTATYVPPVGTWLFEPGQPDHG